MGQHGPRWAQAASLEAQVGEGPWAARPPLGVWRTRHGVPDGGRKGPAQAWWTRPHLSQTGGGGLRTIGQKLWKWSKVGHAGGRGDSLRGQPHVRWGSPRRPLRPLRGPRWLRDGHLRGPQRGPLRSARLVLRPSYPGPTLAGPHPCWGCPPFLPASWPPLGSLPLPPTPRHPSPISLATATHLPGFEGRLLWVHPPDESRKLVPGQLAGRLAPEALQDGGVGTMWKGGSGEGRLSLYTWDGGQTS